jgi:hypothetical protein
MLKARDCSTFCKAIFAKWRLNANGNPSGSLVPTSQESVVAGARNTRFLNYSSAGGVA